MPTDSIKPPMYDAWSNEGGGRDIEMARRQSYAREIVRLREEKERVKATTIEGLAQATVNLDALNKELAQKYDQDGLRRLSEDFRGVSSKDLVTLSPEARDFLRDHSRFAEARRSVAARAQDAATVDARYDRHIAVSEALSSLQADGYDSRFTKDDDERLAAYKRSLAAQERLGNELSAENWLKTNGAAATDRPFAPPAEFKKDESGLFAVDARGNIQVNKKDLEKMGPEQQAIEALKRLVTALTESNGLNQVRDGLIAALDGQNRTIADKAAALTAATKFDGG